MGISRLAAWAAGLLVAASVAGCASPAGPADNVSVAVDGNSFSLGKSAIPPDEVLALHDMPDAEKRRRLDAILAAHPDDLAARFLRLQLEVSVSDVEPVLADSDVVLANPSLARLGRLCVLQWRAEMLVHVGRAGEAVAVANQALEIDESYADAWFSRGWARFHQNHAQAELALADLDRALQLEPDDGVGHYRRAVVLQAQGALDGSAQEYERAVQLVPDDLPSHREYGILLFQTHDLARALGQFDIAMRLAPRDPDVAVWRAQTNLDLRRFDDAEADQRRVDELAAAGEDVARSHRRVADMLEDQLDFARAEHEYQRSMALKANPSVAYWIARMQWFTGQFAQSAAYFREHAQDPDLYPAYAPIWLFIVSGRANPADEPAAAAELARLEPAHEPHAWTDTLVDLMLGKSTLDSALAEADASPTNQLKAGHRCEADYYAAERLLMRGQEAQASRLLEEAYWVCPSTYVEAHAVVAERQLLAARPQAH